MRVKWETQVEFLAHPLVIILLWSQFPGERLVQASGMLVAPFLKDSVLFRYCRTELRGKNREPSWLYPDLCASSVQFSRSVVSDSLRPHGRQHARLPCPAPTPRAYSNSCPLSWWCHPAVSSSVILFFSCLQSFPASGSFPVSQFFASGGQSIGVSASASVLPMNNQYWFPLGWTGWISLQSKGLSGVFSVFSNTPVQKHQFFGAQLSSQSNSHIHTWLLEKP